MNAVMINSTVIENAPMSDDRPDLSEGLDLKDWLGEDGYAVFWKAFQERRPVVIRRGRAFVEAMFENTGGFEEWVRGSGVRLSSGGKDEAGMHEECRITPDEIQAHAAQGRTIRADGLEGAPHFRRWFLDVASALRLVTERGGAQVMMSADGHGYDTHFDAVENLTVQVKGSKRWWFSAYPGVERPTSNIIWNGGYPTGILGQEVTPPPEDGGWIEVVLEPGDILYLPAGHWHKVAAEGRSVHFTLKYRTSTAVDVMNGVLSGWAKASGFGRWLPEPGAPQSNPRAYFRQLLDELRSAIDDGQINEAMLEAEWCRRIETDDAPAGDTPMAIDDHWTADPDYFVGFHVLNKGGASRLVIHRNGVELGSVAPQAKGLVRKILSGTVFSGAQVLEWEPRLTWASAQGFLSSLANMGLIRRLPSPDGRIEDIHAAA